MIKFFKHYGEKYVGAITEKDSLITKENGFDKIHKLKPGESPTDYVNRLDKVLETEMREKGLIKDFFI